VAPGAVVVRTGGNTPGHSVVRLASGRDRLTFAGDFVFRVGFDRPEWPTCDPNARRFFRIIVGGHSLAIPSLGELRLTGCLPLSAGALGLIKIQRKKTESGASGLVRAAPIALLRTSQLGNRRHDDDLDATVLLAAFRSCVVRDGARGAVASGLQSRLRKAGDGFEKCYDSVGPSL
jgi:hypothetical protein